MIWRSLFLSRLQTFVSETQKLSRRRAGRAGKRAECQAWQERLCFLVAADSGGFLEVLQSIALQSAAFAVIDATGAGLGEWRESGGWLRDEGAQAHLSRSHSSSPGGNWSWYTSW